MFVSPMLATLVDHVQQITRASFKDILNILNAEEGKQRLRAGHEVTFGRIQGYLPRSLAPSRRHPPIVDRLAFLMENSRGSSSVCLFGFEFRPVISEVHNQRQRCEKAPEDG